METLEEVARGQVLAWHSRPPKDRFGQAVFKPGTGLGRAGRGACTPCTPRVCAGRAWQMQLGRTAFWVPHKAHLTRRCAAWSSVSPCAAPSLSGRARLASRSQTQGGGSWGGEGVMDEHACVCVCVCVSVHVRSCVRACVRMHALGGRGLQHTQSMHAHTRTHTRTHACAHAHSTHTHTLARTHTHARARPRPPTCAAAPHPGPPGPAAEARALPCPPTPCLPSASEWCRRG